jgi:hypothetical protein
VQRQRPLNSSGRKEPKYQQHDEDDYENEEGDARDIEAACLVPKQTIKSTAD